MKAAFAAAARDMNVAVDKTGNQPHTFAVDYFHFHALHIKLVIDGFDDAVGD